MQKFSIGKMYKIFVLCVVANIKKNGSAIVCHTDLTICPRFQSKKEIGSVAAAMNEKRI